MTKLMKTYKHAASAREAVEHIFGYEPQHDSLSEILRMIAEQAEAKYENAKSSDLSATELKALKMHLDEALREEDLARDLVTELLTAADNLAAGQPHSTLFLSAHNNYSAGPHFTKASLYYWAKDRLGREIADWKLYTEEAPSIFNKGQALFLTMAYLLDKLLTDVDGDWRASLRAGNHGVFIGNQKIKKAALANRIIEGLPTAIPSAAMSANIKGHIELLQEYLHSDHKQPTDLTEKQQSMALRTLFGLARAAWTAPSKPPKMETRIEYENNLVDQLSSSVARGGPLSKTEVEEGLLRAKARILELSSKATDSK